ncbi:MAG: FAD-dependent oxidoreductase [Gammaproteobacteria bacterium]|nr:FAD-dependent oxidoreductase [Gammaproteobacteria bacterium]
MKKYDCIVIGAGNGGLCAALKILTSGKTCLVCEKHNIPGGFATSFVRGRFEFEASLHELNGIGFGNQGGTTRKMLDELGITNLIEWKPVKNAYRLISMEEGIDFILPFGVDNIIKACDTLCENGGEEAKKVIDLSKTIYDAVTYISHSKGKPDPEILKTKYYDYMAVGAYSVNEVFEALHTPDIIKNVLSAYWSYLGVDFDNMSFVHYANMTYSYYNLGAVVPKSRSHEMSLAFEKRIHELGGDIFFNTEVKKILTDKEGHVSGVELENGDVIESRHVIANCSPHNVYANLLDPKVVPERAIKLCNFRKFAGRGLTIFLGLNGSPEELGINEHSYFIYDSSDSVRMCKEMEKLDQHVGQATCCLNNVNPGCSPEGTTILYMTSLYFSDAWKSVKEKDYYKFKNEVANKFIEDFEKATGATLKGHIEEIAIATPLTYARYCGHPQGTIYGYEGTYKDGLMARAMMVNEDAFIPGLRIGGAYGEREIGYPSSYTSGYNEARRTLGDMEKEGL